MRNKILKYYKYYIENVEFKKSDGVMYWRERIFNGLMIVLLIFGSITIIPNLIVSIKTNSTAITITDSVVFILLFIIFLYRRIKFRHKLTYLVTILYSLSIILLLELGPMEPGFIWLAACTLIAAMLAGLRGSIITIITNVLIIVTVAFLIYIDKIDTIFFNSYSLMEWVAISMSLLVFNAITSIPLALLINALDSSLRKEQLFKTKMIRKNKLIEIEKNRAQESDRLKSAFLANLSHEIRTPMNAIVGFSDLIQMDESSEKDLKLYSNNIIQNSLYLKTLIDDIVDISLIESGQIKFNYSNITFNQLFAEINTIIEAIPIRKIKLDISIQYEINSRLNEKETLVDVTHLKQIIINLITNALKYTNKGLIKIGVKKDKNHFKFSVIDSGIGIPTSEQKFIFQRFSKINRQGELSKPGIGIGLSISKALVEALNGKIWFESDEKKGTSFYFTIRSK